MKGYTLIIIGIAVALGLAPIAAMAQSVPLLPINTGDKQLDKQVKQVIKCVQHKKSGLEPTKQEADDCYDQVFGSNSNTQTDTNTNVQDNTVANTNNGVVASTGTSASTDTGSSASASASASAAADGAGFPHGHHGG